MLMKEVDSLGIFFGNFFLFLFFAKDGVPQSIIFLYRSVLCICIYKQIYTNNVSGLSSAFSVKGS